MVSSFYPLWARATLVAAAFACALAAPGFADTSSLHNTTGLAYYYQGKDDLAYDEFVKALELDPTQAQPHFNLGRLFERQNKFGEALEQYRQALELDPTLSEALRAVERLQGQPAPVPGVPSAAPAVSDADIGKLATEIQTAWKTGDKTAARQRLRDSIAANPTAVPLLMLAAEMDEQTGNIAGAIQTLQKARTTAPSSPDVATRLSLLLYRAGLFDQASTEAERAISLNPSLALPYRVLGLVMLTRQKPVEANAYFTEAVRLDPNDEVSKAQISRLGRQLGLIHYNSGLFYFQQQDWERCKDELQQALAQGNLTAEQAAIAQQYLVIAEFSAARVAQQIKKLQDDRTAQQAGRIGRTVTFADATQAPNTYPTRQHAEFEGYIVSTAAKGNGSEIIVTKSPTELIFRETEGGRGEFDQSFRSNAEMTNWFTIVTPKPLPIDSRIRPTSRIRVQGWLGEAAFIRNPYNLAFSKRPMPTIEATYLEINREQRQVRRTQLSRDSDDEGRDSASRRNPLRTRFPTPAVDTAPGPSGPLKIDYLQLPPPKRRLAGG